MKKIIITFAAMLFAGSITLAQEKKPAGKEQMEQVPQAVTDSFAKKYPDVKDARWEKEGKHWEAETKKGGKEFKLIFDVKGNFLYTESHMEVSELPKSVIDFVKAKYPKKKISDVGKIVDVNGIVMYEVEMKGISHMFFDAKGEYLNRED
jgi:hypothetical protein